MSLSRSRASGTTSAAPQSQGFANPRYTSNADRAAKLGLDGSGQCEMDAPKKGDGALSRYVDRIPDELLEHFTRGHTDCGAQDSLLSDVMVPDVGPLTGVDYSVCCAPHDGCYDDPRSSKESCDAELAACMLSTCVGSGAKVSECAIEAGSYYEAVSAFGDKAWEAGQKQTGAQDGRAAEGGERGRAPTR